ncbi:glycosyltransferase family 4 protein [Agromyces intestinalis]|uniref:Glycosyltransferase family 4 protein n=1 Tax=Agromyces intestinalis TaxID=2592652 RepID=A0A5C1YF71_9MICO|nr:glycosyltransferase family 4 protein [Agromyces intestinalis]QEO14175.1 glycosyltransferase family 4 protein [Agromyces intestinalis]
MTRVTVHHLGRSGEHAGGMTQVVNGYLAWRFDEVDVRVITSRADPHDMAGAMRRSAQAFAELVRLPKRAPQVVVGHLSERGSFVREGALLRVAKARGIPTVAHLHGSEFAAFADRHPRLVAAALRSADRVVSLSDESSEVSARYVDAERIVLVPNAIAPGHPAPVKQRIAVFGGVVGRRKGVDVLLEAWRRAAPDDWRLVIAGPIAEADLALECSGVEFAGPLAHDALMRVLDDAAIAVLPSRDEAMPMFVLEALARDCAVVSTRVGGIPAVLRDGAGVLVEPGDVDALATALATLTRSAAARGRLAAAGRRVFDERYSAAAVFPRLERLWVETAQRAA